MPGVAPGLLSPIEERPSKRIHFSEHITLYLAKTLATWVKATLLSCSWYHFISYKIQGQSTLGSFILLLIYRRPKDESQKMFCSTKSLWIFNQNILKQLWKRSPGSLSIVSSFESFMLIINSPYLILKIGKLIIFKQKHALTFTVSQSLLKNLRISIDNTPPFPSTKVNIYSLELFFLPGTQVKNNDPDSVNQDAGTKMPFYPMQTGDLFHSRFLGKVKLHISQTSFFHKEQIGERR